MTEFDALIALVAPPVALEDRPLVKADGARVEHRTAARNRRVESWKMCRTERPATVCRCGQYRIRWS